ncbi:alpha/beta hydrolase [Paenibacillus segetis]|uniref:Hydrolase n=1 Tax=Paenibacillus segetis TaxID=1325360 RepID=A0ABQ1YCL7_9BACL|nr:alpha/beta hydrolase [Paenibacillus segetis]GGH19601.1 hydrolase [Paenibacillus segetis]
MNMEKTPKEQLEAIKGYLKQVNVVEGKSVEHIRQQMEEAVTQLPKLPNIVIEPVQMGDLSGEWVSTNEDHTEYDDEVGFESNQQVILYFHGGGFTSGSCNYYRDLAARISKSSGIKVLVLEYRLAPEHPYPAANEDCLFAYRWLQANGHSADHIVLGGDSVGASLVLMTLLSLRDHGEALPAGAFLISPHSDLVNLDGESYESRAELDPTGSLNGNQAILTHYLGSYSGPIPELLSPLRMDLGGLPELLIQVGDHEVLLSDATRLAERATAAGVQVSLEVWENMWSVFHFLAYMLPEAEQAISNIGQFVGARLKIEI